MVTRKVIDLDGDDWQMGSVPQKPFGNARDIDMVREWHPARVPGDVRLDLLRQGKISDPLFGYNNASSQWVDAQDWWYRRRVDFGFDKDERAFLVGDGIDYQSAVFWNGVELGRHVGMFSRQIHELHLSAGSIGGDLAIRIWGSDALPKLKLSPRERVWGSVLQRFLPLTNEPYPDRYATLKCQMQFGWDFAPRLRTSGIWDDISVVVTGSVFLEDAWIRAIPLGAADGSGRLYDGASIRIAITLNGDRAEQVRIDAKIHGKNFATETQAVQFGIGVKPGSQTVEHEFQLQDAKRWDPWDRGEPNLYEISLVLFRDDQVLDALTTTFGVRSLELVPPDDGSRDAEPWTFVLNGEREFIRGANWVPLDAIPGRLSPLEYRTRLDQARAANVNLLRVWGGGLREKRAFYDLCDEMGILVWQEFPFSGAIFDRFPSDHNFLDLAHKEAGEIIRGLRNHPSLVLWCGGNEFNTRANAAIVSMLRSAVSEADGTRPFKPASPCRDEAHNWRVWHRNANLGEYAKESSPILSEFGLQSVPTVASLRKFLSEEQIYPPNDGWVYHHAQLDKLYRYARSISAEIGSLEDLVDASQRAQARGIQIAVEHMRRRKGKASGVAVWQFNDAWGSISWSLVDYYGVPKLAYEMLRTVYAPVLVSLDYDWTRRRKGDTVRGDLWIVNDLTQEQEVEWRAVLDRQEICSRVVQAAPNSATSVEVLDVHLGNEANVLRLEWTVGGQSYALEYDLTWSDVGEMHPLFKLLYPLYERLMR